MSSLDRNSPTDLTIEDASHDPPRSEHWETLDAIRAGIASAERGN